jgi:hypothetical protein
MLEIEHRRGESNTTKKRLNKLAPTVGKAFVPQKNEKKRMHMWGVMVRMGPDMGVRGE